MTVSEKFFLVKRACEQLKVCQIIVRNEAIPRVVLPIGVCLTAKRGLIIVCRQIDANKGHTKSKPCNLAIEDCVSIKVLEKNFEVVSDTRIDTGFCTDWVVHV
jgi:hypothetical protein